MIYLDNAATSHKHPKCVLKAVKKTILKSANPGRGGHNLSLLAGQEVFYAREEINSFFNGFGADNVILTSSCTQSLNLAIQGTAQKGGHVVATVLEHNSVLRPLQELKSKGIIDFSLAKPNKNGNIDLNSIKNEIKDNTYLIITTHISNLTGAKTSIKEIGNFAKQNGIAYLVDGAQSAGHEKIDMKDCNISFLALPSHKGLLGICGGGALLFNPKFKLSPIIYGGTGSFSANLSQPTQSPEGFESGTLPTPAIASIKAGIVYIKKHQEKISKRIKNYSNIIIEALKNMPKIKLYTKNATGVVAFNVADFASSDIAQILNDKFNICTRAGLHCAPLAHEYLKTTNQGAVRVSVGAFTKKSDIKKFICAINEICD